MLAAPFDNLEAGKHNMQYRRISADCHLDMPWMPPDLFVSEARRELKERMPYVEDGPQGPQWVAKNGANFGLKNGVGPGGAPFVPGQNHRVDKMAETGMYEDGKRDIRRCSDPHLRIKDMDRDGVDAEVIYGILGAASRLNDREASNEMLRIYNDFLKDFCRHYPDREIGLACLPYGNIDDAVTEIHRVAKMGIKGLELSCSWDMEPMWHPVWEPLWNAVEEVQLPLHFHTFPTTSPRAREGVSGQVRRAAMFTGVSAFQMGLINIIAALIGAGVLERHPRLKVSFGESGIGWLPYALDRMDFEYRGPLPRPDQNEAERILAPPVQGDVPVRPDRHQARRRHRRRDPDVGLRLPAHRRRVAGILEIHQGAVRRPRRPKSSTRSPARTPPNSTG